MDGPLAGIRVVEVANWLAGPTTAALLGDLGAAVIKVEPPNGDSWRGYVSAALTTADPRLGHHWAFEMDNRGKRSVTANLDRPEGRAVVHRLAERADVFVTNLSPSRTARYDLTYPTLAKLNERLVYAQITAFGAEGPDQDKLGFDFTAYWARSGLMHLMGDDGDRPIMLRSGMGDHTTALATLAGVLGALFERERSGQGQEIRTSLLNTGNFVLSADLQTTLITGKNPPRRHPTAPPNPIQERYRCADNRWLLLNMPQSDPYWPRVCAMFERPDLIDDPRCATFAARMAHSREVCQLIAVIIATKPLAEWATLCDQQRLIWAPVALPSEVVADPQTRLNEHWATVEHPTLGPFETVQIPVRYGRSPVGPRGPAPEVGQHTEEVLLEVGYTWEEIGNLRDAGAL